MICYWQENCRSNCIFHLRTICYIVVWRLGWMVVTSTYFVFVLFLHCRPAQFEFYYCNLVYAYAQWRFVECGILKPNFQQPVMQCNAKLCERPYRIATQAQLREVRNAMQRNMPQRTIPYRMQCKHEQEKVCNTSAPFGGGAMYQSMYTKHAVIMSLFKCNITCVDSFVQSFFVNLLQMTLFLLSPCNNNSE